MATALSRIEFLPAHEPASNPLPHHQSTSAAEFFQHCTELARRNAHAQEIVDFFRLSFGQIFQRATGVDRFELCAGLLPAVFKGATLVLANLTRFFFALAEAERHPARAQREELIAQGRTLMAWCLRRCAILDLIDHESGERDYLLPLAVNENASVCGMPGIELQCAVKLYHRIGQQLFAKLSFRDEGRPVQRISSWIDQRGGRLLSEESRGEICALIPLIANCRHEVFDDVRLGVPYAALQLEPGWHSIDTVLQIIDEQGVVIAEREEGRVLFVGPAQHQYEPESPQSREIWEMDPTSGSCIEEVSVYQSSAAQICVSCSVTAGTVTSAPLAIRCVPRSAEGFDLLHEHTPRSSILREVDLIRPYEKLGTFYWHFAIVDLDLNPHENEVFFDVSVLGDRGRTLVGALRRLVVERW